MKMTMKLVKSMPPSPHISINAPHMTDAQIADLTVKFKDAVKAVSPIQYAPEAPKKISLEEALNAMVDSSIMIKNIDQTTSYAYDGLQFNLSMAILVTPNTGKEVLDSLNNWFFDKMKAKW